MQTNQNKSAGERTLCEWDSPAATEIVRLREQRDELLEACRIALNESMHASVLAGTASKATAALTHAIARAEGRAE